MQAPNSTPISCAVIYAGRNDESVLLAMESREGRFPAQFVNPDPLYWVCADGSIEHPAIDGPNADQDRARLADEFECGGLVVAELLDVEQADLSASQNWLLEKQSHERQRP